MWRPCLVTQCGHCCLCILLVIVLVSANSNDLVKVKLHRQRYVIHSNDPVTYYNSSEDIETAKRSDSIPEFGHKNLKGTPGQGYCIAVNIGTPAQKFSVLIDTGSSNFAVAGNPHTDIKHYFRPELSTTLQWLRTSVYVPYTQGNWFGYLVSDKVSMAYSPNSTVVANIALIQESSDFFIKTANWEGILGLAYSHLARPHSGIETLFDSMVRQWRIPNVFSLQLCGTTRNNSTASSGSSNMDGTMTIGGIDQTLYTGSLQYVPLRKEWYYEVVITDIKINGASMGMDCKEYNFDKTIVDSGTTDIRLPRRVYNQLVSTLLRLVAGVGERFYQGKTLLCLPEKTGPWARFPMLTFSILHSDNTHISLSLSPQQYLRYIGEIFDIPGKDCFKFGIQTSDKGAILGAVLMEGYYVVFDRSNRQVGFAQSTCNAFESTLEPSKVLPPSKFPGSAFSSSAWDCAFYHPPRQGQLMLLASYFLAALCILCALPVLGLLILRCVRKHFNKNKDGETSKLINNQ